MLVYFLEPNNIVLDVVNTWYYGKKIGQNLIHQREGSLPEKNFWRLARSYRNNLLPCAMNDRKDLGRVWKFPWDLTCLVLRDKKPKTFFTGTSASFSKYSVPNNLSVFWEVMFLFAPILPENFVKPEKF